MYSVKTNFLRKLLAVMMIVGTVSFMASPAYAETIDVNTYDGLTTAISNASSGDVIKLTADIRNPEEAPLPPATGFLESFTIDKDLTIDGDGHTLQGYRPYIYATVTFKDIVLDGKTARNANAGWAWSPGGGLDDYFIQVYGGEVIFDAGTIIQNYKDYSFGVIRAQDATITMKEGAEITDCAALYGIIRIDSYATFNMEGGEIHGCFSSNVAGNNEHDDPDAPWEGVIAYVSNSSTFRMTGGVIRNNTNALWEGGEVDEPNGDKNGYNRGAVYLHRDTYQGNNTFIMTGGIFEGNTAELGGVVDDDNEEGSNTIIVGGTAQGFANFGVGFGANTVSNIYLQEGTPLHISEDYPLEGDAKFGVYTSGTLTEDHDIQIAIGARAGDQARFISDQLETAGVIYDDGTDCWDVNGNKVESHHEHVAGTLWLSVEAIHTHRWQYRKYPDNVLKATCIGSGSCPYKPNGITVTLWAEDVAYSGSPYTMASVEGASTLTAATGLSVGNIKYVGRDGTTYPENETAPTNEGKYTAKVQIGDYTLTKDFFIAPAGSHVHDGIIFNAWDSDTSLPTEEGSYYLTQDVTLDEVGYQPQGTVSLCLNGKRITVTADYVKQSIYHVTAGNTLNLYDCGTTVTSGYVNNRWQPGTSTSYQMVDVVGGYTYFEDSYEVGCVCVMGGVFNQYGGNLSGGSGHWYDYDGPDELMHVGGVTVRNNGEYNLFGGTVVGCKSSESGGPSSVLVTEGSSFNMYGGVVKACGDGDNSICIESGGEFNMYDGKIGDNIGTMEHGSKTIAIEGVFNMYGGEISNNSVNSRIFGSCLSISGTFNMYGGKISDNNTKRGAVDVRGNFTLGGNAVIENNKDMNDLNIKRNVYLPSDSYITLATGEHAPQDGMQVGVTMLSGIGRFTTINDNAEDYMDYFFADSGEAVVTCPDNYLALHVHGNWWFASEGNVINATCGNEECSATPYTCPFIILNAPNKIWDGEQYNAAYYEMVSPISASMGELVYYNRNDLDNPLSEAPTEIGNYTVTLTVTGTNGSATAMKDFYIAAKHEMRGGDYYLYNIASGKWFGAGNENGFQASLTEAPEFVRVGGNPEESTIYEDAGSSTEYLPMYGYYADSYTRSQYVIPATDLAEMSGSLINSLTYYTTSTPSQWQSPFKVYLKEVDFTTMAELIDPNTATEVYVGQLTVANGTMLVEFTTPFRYNGGNLLIGMDCIESYNNYSRCYFKAIYAPGAGMYSYNYDYYFNWQSIVDYIPTTTFGCLGNESDDVFAIESYISQSGRYFDGRVISSPTPCPVQFMKPISQDGSAIDDDICTITSTNGDAYGYDGTSVLSHNAEGENSHWRIYTKAQLIEGLSEATLNQPKDATFFIFDPSFRRSSSWFSRWNGGPSNEGSHSDMHASMEGGKFNVYQDLELNLDEGEEIPNGIYELSVQGFYSSTSDKKCAYFYANSETTALKDIASAEQQPTTEEEASAAFTAGEYQCKTIRLIVINHKIRIGVKGIYDECGWTAFDNFRLTYLGPTNQLNH